MDLCSDGHDEICYEGGKCPACEVISEKDDYIASLENDLEVANTENKELKQQIDELEAE